MKKINLSRILLVCSLCITLSTAHAQYVAIPDSNFGNWLHNNGYSSCLTGNSVSGFRLDTTCSAVLSADSIECRNSNIYNLTGIQYFHHITYLDCDDNQLASIPALPSTLTTLITNNNILDTLPALPASLTYLSTDTNSLTAQPTLPPGLVYLETISNPITSLPSLPATLKTLNCHFSTLTSLPALPASLTTLNCYYNDLTSLPSLPAGLTILDCRENQLTSLPALPTSLSALYCSNNQLTSLPALPTSLSALDCSNNLLTSLPTLPQTLQNLSCGNNRLTSLPTLPDTMNYLDCAVNLLTSLPRLPNMLTWLDCYDNQLTSLPSMPAGLNFLECSTNNISSIPALPWVSYLGCGTNPLLSCLPHIYQNVLQTFYISGTAITCLPNSFTAINYDVNPATMPLCAPSSGCNFYNNISGSVHFDTMGTCLSDSLQPGQALGGVKVQLKQGGKVVQQIYTLATGGYSFRTDSLTGYTVDIDTSGLPISVVCPSSGSRYVLLATSDSDVLNEDFGIVCNNADTTNFGILNISASNVHPFRTSLPITTVYISAGLISMLKYNADCSRRSISGTITTTYSGSVQYAGPGYGALTPSSISGKTLTYNIADLSTLPPRSFDIAFTTDTNAVIGSSVCITVILVPFASGLGHDTLTQCFVVHDPHDPNYKDVYPTTLTPDGGWLTYTVEFQNTGNDTAYTVVVKDTLSPYVDASTFQYLASSHKVVVQLFGNAMVFTFPKINLVDSVTNPPLSIGWIQYKVKSKPNLPLNTQVNNTAYIYFDQNPAVVTNTAVTTVGPTGIRPVLANNSIRLYPNPNKGAFTLQTANSINSTYTITDMLGHVITQQAITADKQAIDMSGIAAGVYTLTVRGTSLRFTVFSFQ